MSKAPPKHLNQELSDEYLFHELAQVGTINLQVGRPDEVVENMLRMRDEGDHPSVISATDQMPSGRSRAPRRLAAYAENDEEEEVAGQWKPAAVPQITEFDSASNVQGWAPPARRGARAAAAEDDDRMSRKSNQSDRKHVKSPIYEDPKVKTPKSTDDRDDRHDRRRRDERDDRYRDDRSRDDRYRDDRSRDDRHRDDRHRSDRHRDDDSRHDRYPKSDRHRDDRSHASSRQLSAFGTGGDIASRYAKPSAPTPFQQVMQRQLAELNAPPKPPSVAPLPALATLSRISVAESEKRAPSRHSPRRQSSRDSAIESSVSHPSRRGNKYRGSYQEREEEEERQSRHEIIMELDKNEIAFDEEEPTWKLRHKLERVTANRMAVAKVKFIRMGIQLGSTAVEQVVCRIFPRLPLKGWAEGLNKDMATGNYDTALEQVYRKIFRKGGMPSAWGILIMVIFGSALLHVIGMRGSGGAAGEEGAAGPVTQFNGVLGMLGPLMSGLGGGFGGGGGNAAPRPTAKATVPVAASVTGATRTRAKIAPPVV
jgi:hypothetical protein